MPINVICGPDGVGKTTLASLVVEKLSPSINAQYMYGGKKSNHYLFTTTITHAILKGIRRVPLIRNFARHYQSIIFYPFEYLEYWARYLVADYKNRQKIVVFIDRFVVDRMWRAYLTDADESIIKKHIEDKFYSRLYEFFFPSIDNYIFLLPPSSVIYQRAPTEYSSYQQCIVIREAYKKLALHLQSRGKNIYIIQETAKPDTLALDLLQHLNYQ